MEEIAEEKPKAKIIFFIIFGIIIFLLIILTLVGLIDWLVALMVGLPLIFIIIVYLLLKKYVLTGKDIVEEIPKNFIDEEKILEKVNTIFLNNGKMVVREDITISEGNYGVDKPTLIYTVRGRDYWSKKEYVILVTKNNFFGLSSSFIPYENPSQEIIDKFLNELSQKPERIITKKKVVESALTGMRETSEEHVPESEMKKENLKEKIEEEKV